MFLSITQLREAKETTGVLEKKLKEAEESLRAAERTERKNRVAVEKIEARVKMQLFIVDVLL